MIGGVEVASRRDGPLPTCNTTKQSGGRSLITASSLPILTWEILSYIGMSSSLVDIKPAAQRRDAKEVMAERRKGDLQPTWNNTKTVPVSKSQSDR
jgi:hypothetical protein